MPQPDLGLDERAVRFMHRLQQYPELQQRYEVLLAVVENADGDTLTADEAEQRVVEELRQLGQRALQDWAARKEARLECEYETRAGYQRKEKKESTGRRASAR